jgi:MoaA/NifB/PqqE/SkfB family radical SAM enzyme
MTANLKNTLNIKSKLGQKSVQEYIERIDWSFTSDSPFIVEFDPTSNCNLACPDCISGSLLNQGQIERDRIKSLTTEMVEAGVKGVILIGGGEPMMHLDIGWVIETLGGAGIKIGITTNGLYLKKHLDVTSKYADWVRVSMDAATSETFNRIRPSKTGKSLFDSAINNMQAYARVKQGKLGYSFMVFSEGNYGFKGVAINTEKVQSLSHIKTNAHEIYAAARLAREIGCDYFEVKPMYDVNHYSVMQKQAIADMVEEQIDHAKTLETDSFKVFEALKLRATLRGESNLEPKTYTRCAVAHMRTLVTSSGVYVCPYFRGVESKNIGDIDTMSFKEMWHGQKRMAIMENLDPSRDCPMHCIRHESNITIEDGLKNGFDAPIDDYDLFI